VPVLVTEGGEETPSALVTLSGFQRFYAEKTHNGRAILRARRIDRGDTFTVDADKRVRSSWTALFVRGVALRCVLVATLSRARCIE